MVVASITHIMPEIIFLQARPTKILLTFSNLSPILHTNILTQIVIIVIKLACYEDEWL